MLVEKNLAPGIGHSQGQVLQFPARIEMAGVEVAAPVEGPVIGHVNDPGSRFSLGRIVQGGFAEEEEKDFLHQVIGLGFVPEDPESYVAHNACVATEEKGKGFPLSMANFLQQS